MTGAILFTVVLMQAARTASSQVVPHDLTKAVEKSYITALAGAVRGAVDSLAQGLQQALQVQHPLPQALQLVALEAGKTIRAHHEQLAIAQGTA